MAAASSARMARGTTTRIIHNHVVASAALPKDRSCASSEGLSDKGDDLHFDIGDGTADLEHRNELPVLFNAQPAMPVKLRIRENGSPSIARLEIHDEAGRVYPMQAKRLAPDFFFQ